MSRTSSRGTPGDSKLAALPRPPLSATQTVERHAGSDTVGCGLNKLPQELWGQVTSHLGLKDRKTCARTNWRFNYAVHPQLGSEIAEQNVRDFSPVRDSLTHAFDTIDKYVREPRRDELLTTLAAHVVQRWFIEPEKQYPKIEEFVQRAGEGGDARPEVLSGILSSMQEIVQCKGQRDRNLQSLFQAILAFRNGMSAPEAIRVHGLTDPGGKAAIWVEAIRNSDRLDLDGLNEPMEYEMTTSQVQFMELLHAGALSDSSHNNDN